MKKTLQALSLVLIIALLISNIAYAQDAIVVYDIESYEEIEPVLIYNETTGEYDWVNPGVLRAPEELQNEEYGVSPIAEEDEGRLIRNTQAYYGPGNNYVAAHNLSNNTTVNICEKEGSYYQITYTYGGDMYYAYVPVANVDTTYVATTVSYSENLAVTSKNGNGVAQSVTVYSGPGTAFAVLGTVGDTSHNSREIVSVLKASGSYTYIEYKTSSGAYKRGFVKTSQLTIPDSTLEKPIRSGNLSQDFKASSYNGISSHNGIDISTSRLANPEQPVYAIAAGTITMYQKYATISGTEYLVSYGNEIELVYNYAGSGYKAIYAHLSDFTYGDPIIPKDNTRQLSSNDVTVRTRVIPVEGSSETTKTVQKGSEIGKSGNTGNSYGAHLHFEIKSTSGQSVNQDPFVYVVFPAVGYYV